MHALIWAWITASLFQNFPLPQHSTFYAGSEVAAECFSLHTHRHMNIILVKVSVSAMLLIIAWKYRQLTFFYPAFCYSNSLSGPYLTPYCRLLLGTCIRQVFPAPDFYSARPFDTHGGGRELRCAAEIECMKGELYGLACQYRRASNEWVMDSQMNFELSIHEYILAWHQYRPDLFLLVFFPYYSLQ